MNNDTQDTKPQNDGLLSVVFGLKGSDERIEAYRELRTQGDHDINAQIEAHDALTWIDRIRMNFSDAVSEMEASDRLDASLIFDEELAVFSDAYKAAEDTSAHAVNAQITKILEAHPKLEKLGHTVETIYASASDWFEANPEDKENLDAARDSHQVSLAAETLDA